MTPRECPKTTCPGHLQLMGTGQLGATVKNYWQCANCGHYVFEETTEHEQPTLSLDT